MLKNSTTSVSRLPYLTVTQGLPRRVFRIDEPGSCLVGRAADCRFVLPHPDVSRYHCRFHWDGTRCTVEDLGSRRGTKMNGADVTKAVEVQGGAEVVVGSVVIQFQAEPDGHLLEPNDSHRPATMRLLVHGEAAEEIDPPEGAEWVMGRDAHCDVVLDHPGVSRRHASVRRLPGGGCSVADLRSSAGSFVNGHRFDSHELTIGDRLQIGPFHFRYNGGALVQLRGAGGASLTAIGLAQKADETVLLRELSFELSGARFIGILGPSGAGKSTLLQTLAGIVPPAEGKIYVDGCDLYGQAPGVGIALVPQDDIVHRELTVLQALHFAGRLRLPASTPEAEMSKLITQTLEQLGLRPFSGVRIANLSGGQRKRVSIAVELLAKPAILFLDEPSSGLDPASERQLMELLRDLSNTGCMVICTTHVIENAHLMDELLVLVDGRLAYVGTPQDAREYFGIPKLHALYEKLAGRPAAEWQAQFMAGRPEPEPPHSECAGSGETRARPFSLPTLLARQWAILASDWRNFAILAGQPVLIALLVAWVAKDESLALFFGYIATIWFGCSNAAQELVKEAPIYRRERIIGVGAHPYLVSKFLFLFLVTAAQAMLLYGCLTAGIGGTTGTILVQVCALLGAALAAVGIGAAISAVARNVMQSVLIVPLVLIPQILFSGQPAPANEMSASVYAAAQVMPTFAAQSLMDVSFLWDRQVSRETLEDHWTSVRNLQRQEPVRTGEIFQRTGPLYRAAAVFAGWALAAYATAWALLRRRARL